MATFDQRGQHVTYQYNAAGNINFGSLHTKADVALEIEKLLSEVSRACTEGVIDEERAVEVESKLKVAVIQAKKPEPDKKRLLDYLSDARALLEGVVAAAGLVAGIKQAIDVVGKFL